jgi:site-specific DNA-methyltransferase (adenine-specific)
VGQRRKPTSTSSFGVGRREAHDASDFYARFAAPTISTDELVRRPSVVDQLYAGDARRMDEVEDASVALVVTSPPYFAGKEYEEAMGSGHVPATYLDYLEMLTGVFTECVAKLEPGGRIAVNVANLGRKPYRSLASDVVGILQDRLGLLLRGELVWWKARGAAGSCAWGSFQSPANPVLRDLTERVVIAGKGRFDRALASRRRAERGLPSEPTIGRDEFLEATTDVWEIPSERARRVGHPAPFPVELPQRLIELFTYLDDLVLDPFMGSGTTAVAALRTGRHFVGYDTDEGYVAAARARVDEERRRLAREGAGAGARSSAAGGGPQAREVARRLLEECGFVDVRGNRRLPGGVTVDLTGRDKEGDLWHFQVCGGFTTVPTGLRRAETLWTSIGRAAVVRSAEPKVPLVLLATDTPPAGSEGAAALDAVRPDPVFDVVALVDPGAHERLRRYAAGEDDDGQLVLP